MAENTVKKIVDGAGLLTACRLIAGKLPTKVSELANDSKYQTDTEVSAAVAAALAGIVGIKFEVVTALPETGENGTIYLISAGGNAPNIYTEYVWIGTAFEQLGTTEIDMTQYWAKNELVAMTDDEITEIFNTAFTA